MKKITIKELANYELAKTIEGFGLCGYSKEGGYIYASEGFGNMETYLTIGELIDMLKKDNMQNSTINVSLNDQNEITYLHMDVYPA